MGLTVAGSSCALPNMTWCLADFTSTDSFDVTCSCRPPFVERERDDDDNNNNRLSRLKGYKHLRPARRRRRRRRRWRWCRHVGTHDQENVFVVGWINPGT